jgi:peptidoglycan/LPS O-acetylase OafA/YrhL
MNTRALNYIGKVSYSLYLWQNPFLNPDSSSWAATLPVNLGLATGAALASYYLIEKPSQKLRPMSRVSEPGAAKTIGVFR